jgi:hypothetical protein
MVNGAEEMGVRGSDVVVPGEPGGVGTPRTRVVKGCELIGRKQQSGGELALEQAVDFSG